MTSSPFYPTLRRWLTLSLPLLCALWQPECAFGATAPPLSCPSNGNLYTTPAFIGQRMGYNPATQAYEPTDYSTNNGNAYYGNPDQVPIAVVGGFAGFESVVEWYLPSDVQSLITSLAYQYAPELSPELYSNNSRGVKADNNNQPGGEASLDIDALISFCPQCRSGLFPIADENDDSFLDVFVDILQADTPPLVVSSSYGYTCDGCLPAATLQYYDSVFQSLAAMGISVLVSSGDDGTNGAGRPSNHISALHSARSAQ